MFLYQRISDSEYHDAKEIMETFLNKEMTGKNSDYEDQDEQDDPEEI